MAKLKFSPRRRVPEKIFEQSGNLFDLENDIHPSISDFVVNVRRQQKGAAAPRPADDMELRRDVCTDRNALTFISFGSGSSGNCSYLGTSEGGVLIDAGVDADFVRDSLRRHGIGTKAVRGIIITHDHTDHVKYVYSLVRKHPEIGVYCTPKTLTGMLRRHNMSRRIKDYHRAVYKEFAFRVGPFEITPFDVSHDGTDNVGYFIAFGDMKIAVATDLGEITPRVDFYMRQANHIVIESNYDSRMLAHGPYPLHLQARIAASHGHLDNEVTAAFVASIASERLRSVFLCHLSHDNNLPEKALAAVREALVAAGFDSIGDASGSIEARAMPLQLTALPRSAVSPLFTLT